MICVKNPQKRLMVKCTSSQCCSDARPFPASDGIWTPVEYCANPTDTITI